MKILIVGCGVIGTTYGYIFQKAGYDVEHLIRDNKKDSIPTSVYVNFLDGRFNNKGEVKNDLYNINVSQGNAKYDFILVSVSSGKIQGVVNTLKAKNISGTLLIMSGIWEDRIYIDKILKGYDYVLGYPVAGGNINNGEINCCAFDHIILELKEKTNIKNYDELVELLSKCSIKIETPFDMLQWIYIHMAINAAVISTAAEYGDITDTSKAAENLMDSSKILSEAVLTIRETVKIVESRDINLKNYNNELLPYKIPSKLAGIIMKRMFSKNTLTRSIMTLHNNMDDLVFVCKNLYDCGKKNNIEAYHFYSKYEDLLEKIK